MAIDVDALLSDADLDNFLGGQVNVGSKLLPKGWTDSLPARQHALDEILRMFRDATPPIEEADITDVSRLAHAVKVGASARLYFLALSRVGDTSAFYAMFTTYTKEFEREARKQIDIAHKAMQPDPKGRGRRSVSLVRR